MRESDVHNTSQRGELVRGWSASGNLFASVVTGMLIGLGLDAVFGTRPLFTILFVVTASVGGFFMLRSSASAAIDAHAQEAIRIRDGL